MALWRGAGAVKQKEKYKAQENCQVTNFRFVWWYTGGGTWLLGKCEGVTEKSDEFISEWEVESEKTSFTVKENGCQQVSTFLNHFLHYSHWDIRVNIILHVKLVFPDLWKFSLFCSPSQTYIFLFYDLKNILKKVFFLGQFVGLSKCVVDNNVTAKYSIHNSDSWGSWHHEGSSNVTNNWFYKLEKFFKALNCITYYM